MRVTFFLVGVLVAIVYANADTVKSYSGYQLWRLKATNNHQIHKLLDFSRRAHQYNVNFWSEEFRVDLPVNPQSFIDIQPFLFIFELDRCYHCTGISGNFPSIFISS